MNYFAGNYDVAVIGAGHAGIEAALASARLGASTVVFTVNLDWIGNMGCNPSIGGTSKHLSKAVFSIWEKVLPCTPYAPRLTVANTPNI